MDRYRGALDRTAGVRSGDEDVINTGIDRFVALFSDFRPDPSGDNHNVRIDFPVSERGDCLNALLRRAGGPPF